MEGALADAKHEIAQVQGVIAEKDQAIKELQEKLAIKGQMRYKRPFYWRVDDDKKEGPFCQKCYDSDGKLIHLQQRHGRDEWHCRQCGQYYKGPGYVPPHVDDERYNPLNWGRG